MDDDLPLPAPPRAPRSIAATLRNLALTLLVLAALWFGLRYILTPLVLNKSPAATDDPRISQLEERIAKLEAAPTPAPPVAVDVTALENRITTLEEKILQATATPHDTTASVDSTALDALKDEIAQIKSDNHTALRRLLLTHQLIEALRAGRPYASELGAILAVMPEQQETLAPLQADATVGIATVAALQSQFPASLHAAITPKNEPKSFTGSLRSLVKIRKTGEAQRGTDDGAILARAEAKLARADVAATVQEIESLSAAAAPEFASWLARARAHLVAMHLASTLGNTP